MSDDPAEVDRAQTSADNGAAQFRYVQALRVNESCLECHGEPAGEIDITGFPKEGWTLDSIGGAISIVIPLEQQYQALRENVIRDVGFLPASGHLHRHRGLRAHDRVRAAAA